MRKLQLGLSLILCSFAVLNLTSCATQGGGRSFMDFSSFSSRMPTQIASQGKVIVVDPRLHAWGAYDNGNLIRGGIATAGGDWCDDIKRPCHTTPGTFRISSLGSPSCISHKYPLPHGGGLMPYCMFFNGSQSLHGAPDDLLADNNLSHGCVRMRIQDAAWVRYNFANVGTKVIVKPYI